MDTNGNRSNLAQTAAIKQLEHRLNEDRTVQAIDRLLDRIELLEQTVARLTLLIEQGPGFVAMATDTIDEAYRKTQAQGIDLEQRLGAVLGLANQLTTPQRMEQFNTLLKLADQAPGLIAMVADILDEEAKKASDIDFSILLDTGKQISQALAKSKELPVAKVGGIFSMLRTMRDPDRQRAIGYLMNIAKAWGQELQVKSRTNLNQV